MIFDHILDDAALFPPADTPADVAVPAHLQHRRSARARYVGPFVVPVSLVTQIANLSAESVSDPLGIALTLTDPGTVADSLARAADLEQIRVHAVEVKIPAGITAAAVVSPLSSVAVGSVPVYVEVPRDDRRDDLIAALADTGLRAKFRTGGTAADAYPDERELADAIHHTVAHAVAFKVTAGLHRAVRNTDAATGFEQHGFLNIIAAVAAATDGAEPADLAAILRSRDATALAETVADLTVGQSAAIRQRFRSFGTCSIIEPLRDLARLELLPARVLDGHPRGWPA